jgi:hypothetical protein
MELLTTVFKIDEGLLYYLPPLLLNSNEIPDLVALPSLKNEGICFL